MAKFLKDSFDGEHLFPSDMFVTEPPSKHGLTNPHFSSCMDDLAQQLSALTLLKQNQRTLLSKPPFEPTQNLQRFGPVDFPVRCDQENPYCQGCFKPISKPGLNGSELYYEYNIKKPVEPNKVDVFLETGPGRVLQRQHYQQKQLQLKLNQNRVLQNRFGAGFVKVSGGTGVFHPRVLDSNYNFAPTTISTPFVKKKQVMRHNRSEIQGPSQRDCSRTTTNTTSLGRYQFPSEMALPKDWSY